MFGYNLPRMNCETPAWKAMVYYFESSNSEKKSNKLTLSVPGFLEVDGAGGGIPLPHPIFRYRHNPWPSRITGLDIMKL